MTWSRRIRTTSYLKERLTPSFLCYHSMCVVKKPAMFSAASRRIFVVSGLFAVLAAVAAASSAHRLVWNFTIPHVKFTPPGTCTNGCGLVFFGSDDGQLTALNSTSGSSLWSRQFSDGISVSPTYDPATGYVFVSTSSGGVHALETASGSTVWTQSLELGGAVFAPVISSGLVMMVGSGTGYLTAFEALTGNQVWWQYQASGAPAVMNGIAYVGTEGGSAMAIDLQSGNQNWATTPSRTATLATPALGFGRAVFASSNGVELFDSNSGDVVSVVELPTMTTSATPIFIKSQNAAALRTVNGMVAVYTFTPQVAWTRNDLAFFSPEIAPKILMVQNAPDNATEVIAVFETAGKLRFLDPATGNDCVAGQFGDLPVVQIAGTPTSTLVADGSNMIFVREGTDTIVAVNLTYVPPPPPTAAPTTPMPTSSSAIVQTDCLSNNCSAVNSECRVIGYPSEVCESAPNVTVTSSMLRRCRYSSATGRAQLALMVFTASRNCSEETGYSESLYDLHVCYATVDGSFTVDHCGTSP